MPELSVFCPACGRSVYAEQIAETGPRNKVLAALAYLALAPAIILLLVPSIRKDRFVRFHAWQSVIFAIASVIFAVVLRISFVILSLLPFVGFLLAWLSLGIGCIGLVVLWVVLVVKALQGQDFELPVVGVFAARLASGV
jgi:uncharacterized membrane protein